MSNRLVILSGCSGGGKSTLLAELGRREHGVVEEPGRRVVQAELASGGDALPWADMAAFARRCIETALADLEAAERRPGWVFFDRSLVDAASAQEALTGEPVHATLGHPQRRYHRRVFLAPPWREIYVEDPERRHAFEAGVAEYDRLQRAYPALGYEVVTLPKASVPERADFVLAALSA